MSTIYKHWWEADEKENEGIFSTLNALRSDISVRNIKFRRYIESYMNRTITTGYGMGAFEFSPYSGVQAQSTSRGTSLSKAYKQATREPGLILNASESAISTLASRIAAQKPRANFLTSIFGPDVWDLHLQAEQLEKFVAGKWINKKLYKKMVKVFIDMCVCGFGVMKVYSTDDDIEYERVFPPEFIIDERAALTSDPNMAYIVKTIPAEILKARYPGNDEAIDKAKGANPQMDEVSGQILTTDLVFTAEAWHLPSSKKSTDGKHVICVKDSVLFKEEWKRPNFPFVVFKYSEPPFGWYPPGLMEQQEPVQAQVNKMLGRVQDGMHIHSVSKTFYEEGSIDKKDLRNATGDMVPHKVGSKPPTVHMPNSVSSEIFKFIWQLHAKIFENSGVSQLSASAKAPSGIESGRALRVLQDSETGRHALLNETRDDGFMELAELTVYEAREVYKRKGSFKSNYPNRNYTETIDWKDIDLERYQYEMQIFPSSMLPNTPAGRLETVQELLESGLINEAQANELLAIPDLDNFQTLEQAGKDGIDHQIGLMLSKGEAQHPEPYQPLDSGIKWVGTALLYAKRMGAPKKTLQLLLDWMMEARELLNPKQEVLAPPQGAVPLPGGEMPPDLGVPPAPMAPALPPAGLPNMPMPGMGGINQQ